MKEPSLEVIKYGFDDWCEEKTLGEGDSGGTHNPTIYILGSDWD